MERRLTPPVWLPPLRRAAAAAIVALFAAFTWIDVEGPALAGLAIAASGAIGWCIWLERHRQTPSGSDL